MCKTLGVLLGAAILALPALALGADAPKKSDPKPEPAQQQPSADPQQGAQMMGALQEAMQAGMKAPQGATLCESDYNSTKAMYDVLSAKMPEMQKKKKLLAKEKFIAACKELPETMQRCIGVTYGLSHAAECQEAQSKLDPAMKAKMQQLAE